MKNIMKRAHEIKNESAAKFNCKPSEIVFSICLEMAHKENDTEKDLTISERIKVRGCSIFCIDNPEWGTFGVMEDCGLWFNIHGRGGSRTLSKSEANKFWSIA